MSIDLNGPGLDLRDCPGVVRCARWIRVGVAVSLCVAMAGCAVLDKPVRQAVYDFGPGLLAAATPVVVASGLPVVTLADVESASALDSPAILYRLGYANAQQLLPYALARWSMAPAQLLRQRLRDTLGQRRTVLSPGDGHVTGSQATMVLRVDLEEFSQLFGAPGQSVGLLRMRATVVQSTAAGERLIGQRLVVVQRPAPSADAQGGVQALAEAADAAVQELEQWLNQLR